MIERFPLQTALPISAAVRAGDFVFASGQAALADDGSVIDGGIVPQTHKTIERLLSAFKDAGCEAADVVKVTVWLDDPRDFAAFNRVYTEYFGKALPARSTLVSALVVDAKVEIEATAYKPRSN